MHHLFFMIGLTGLGVVGSLTIHPFVGIAVYYLFAVLRPQFLWEWSLPMDTPWSYYVAISVIASVSIWRMAVMLAPHRHRHFDTPRFNIGHWMMLFFAVWATVTCYTAISVPTALPFYEEYKKIFLMFFISALAIMKIRQVWTLFLIMVLSLIYIAYEINEIYFLQGGYMYVYNRGYAGLDNNGAALMLAMGVPLCLFAWDGIRHWSRWGFLLAIPLILHAVLTSYSRGAMLSLILSIPIYLARCRHRGQLLIILGCLIAMVPILAGKEIQERFFTINEHEQDASAQSRLVSWGIAWQMAQERPIFGFGIRNSSLFTFAYGADMEGRVIHSQYLQIAADSGLVGLAAYLLAIGAFLYCLWRVRRQVKGHTSIFSYLLAIGYLLTTGRWNPKRQETGRDDPEILRAYTIANGLEGAMIVFCIGAAFLSLETFELPYIALLMGAQLWAICRWEEEKAKQTGSPTLSFPTVQNSAATMVA